MIDVQDPTLNLILNACFFGTIALALVAIIPWKALGFASLSHHLRWLAPLIVVMAIIHEAAMPPRFDIRIDLVMLAPLYAIIILTSLCRWRSWRSARTGSCKRADHVAERL